MSTAAEANVPSTSTACGACGDCLRRSWIVHCLGPRLDVRRYHTEQIAEIFALEEPQLLAALGVGTVAELEARHGPPQHTTPHETSGGARLWMICRHDTRYPCGPRIAAGMRGSDSPSPSLDGWAPPPVLRVAGAPEGLRAVARAPAVAIVGARRATDYGLAMADRLARELADSGLPVLSALAEGVASAAHAGTVAAGGGGVTVMAAGVERAHPASKRSLYEAILRDGCAVSELPFGARPRRWAYAARHRIVAGLATLVVVVEAEERPGDLMLPRFARALGRAVVAVPGRVTSPASRGVHTLIREGVPVVRHAQDVVDALYGADTMRVPEQGIPLTAKRSLSGATRRVLELVSAGSDTADRLVESGIPLERGLAALTELELVGELIRGDGGRYVPCSPYASGSHAGL